MMMMMPIKCALLFIVQFFFSQSASLLVSSRKFSLKCPSNLCESKHSYDNAGKEFLRKPFDERKINQETSISNITTRLKQRSSRVDKVEDDPAVSTFLSKPPIEKESVPEDLRLDLVLSCAYACSMIALTTPVVLLPVIAVDHAATSTVVFIAGVASFATLGGALGKFVNGFVCQAIGGKTSSRTYLLGMSAALLFLSQTSVQYGPALACMEFFSSMTWISCTVILADAYEKSPEKFSQGITALSLASTSSTLLTKIVGAFLLKFLHWRQVSQIAAAIALLGAAVLHTFVRDENKSKNLKMITPEMTSISADGILKSMGNVLGSPIFWLVGFGHTMGMMARRSDQLLGGFFQTAADVPSYLCGGLTSSITLGFVLGIVSSKYFQKLKLDSEKKDFVRQRYIYAFLSALGLALCAKLSVFGVNTNVVGCMIAVASCAMASSVSFQFYQLPPICAKLFGRDQAVCVSFLDGIAFLLVAPIWLGLGNIISRFGWAAAWTAVASFLGVGGIAMVKALPDVLEFSSDQEAGYGKRP